MAKYRKKPVVVDAFQWKGWQDDLSGLGGYDPFNVVEPLPILRFLIIGLALGSYPKTGGCSPRRLGWVKTLEGGHIVRPFDYIIKGVEGEFYPCKPDIFEQTYELVEEPAFHPD